jgi:hypothetical protein
MMVRIIVEPFILLGTIRYFSFYENIFHNENTKKRVIIIPKV